MTLLVAIIRRQNERPAPMFCPRPGSTLRRSVFFLPLQCLLLCSLLAMPAIAKNHALIISGLGGEPEYAESFKLTGDIMTQALQSLDNQDDLIVHLHESPTRDDILTAIETVADKVIPEEASTFTLMLIGHGTADSRTWKFNVAGPDLTTEDLVGALNGVPTQQQLIILATSASGAALEALSQPQRVVVTATKSGGEINAVRFPEFLAEAVSSNQADYDRNEILTIGEAFRFAQSRTAEYYEQQKLLASEHARLRGDNASGIALALLGSLKEASDDPVVAALLDDRLTLEEQFKALKRDKDNLPAATYYSRLETLLISIAQLQQSIDAETGWSETDADS